jgi:NAD(P)H dehydrogenase (quinone)
MKGALVGKVGSVIAGSGSQHGGNETTITTFHTVLFHHGMVVVGLPYAYQGQMGVDTLRGGSPYGATYVAGGDGSRAVTAQELEAARFQGEHVAKVAAKLSA